MKKKPLNRLANIIATASAIATASMLCATSAYAASQGSMGASSTGSLDITMDAPGMVRVSDFVDMSFDLATWDGVSPYGYSDGICVWSNTGGYNVTATGDGPAGSFEISFGGSRVPYSVTWADQVSAADPLTTAVALTTQQATVNSTTCNSGADNTATVQVIFAATDLAMAIAGSYSGTLTVVVAPE